MVLWPWIVAGALLTLLGTGGALRFGPRWIYAACGIAGLVGMFVFGCLACFATFASAHEGRPPDTGTFLLFILSTSVGFGGMIGSIAHKRATEEERRNSR